MTWLYLGGAILCEVAATLSLKGSATVPVLYIVVVAGYLASFVFLTAVLKRGMGVGVAYGIWAATGVALVACLSALLFGEAFTMAMAIGLACIIAGVLMVETGSRPVRTDVGASAAGD
ncbi:Spermidine export protein MdtJ [Mycolicibacterium vanbaalenii]|uniref:Spermidine export protein MdtJ n=1 Tax=Mycolicibacterium vanbaalenii TaxID=110539 RepID=A0A5S9N125_MYCVN|nr:SMR family transporter [Mycolicibacterium vanbaalenii]CAA0082680.1 Spermidine export protein MdtJ [Mycolicibacterium vanbaalenii]